MDAKQWFEERMYSENYLSNESGMQLYKDWMPDWKRATVHQLAKSKTVEIPLIFNKQINAVSPDAYEEYERTKDLKYLQNDIKLVIETSLSTGEKRDFIMNIAPSLKYINLQEKGHNSYRNIDTNFDGMVIYFNLEWNLVNEWRYADGKIFRKIVTSDIPETPELATRAIFCEIDYWYIIVTGAGLPVRLIEDGYSISCYEVDFYDTEDSEPPFEDGGAGGGGYLGDNDIGTPPNILGNGNNLPKVYRPLSGDKLFRTSFSQTMITQIGETCALASMGYVNALFGGSTHYLIYLLEYAELYHSKDSDFVLKEGVLAVNIPSFVSNYFNTGTFTSYQNAINAGHVVLTDIPTGQSYSHCVVVVGYRITGDLIYMDPERGVLMECKASFPLGNIKIRISGNK